MDDLTSLLTHYDFWDCLVEKWRDGEFGRDTHMPEPWWGWHPENGPLYSVTVNLNPGVAGKLQTQQCIKCAFGCSGWKYSDLMSTGSLCDHLHNTEQWHLNRRYKTLMRALGVDGKIIKGIKGTKNHLSIELKPFHNEKNSPIYWEKQPEDLIEHTLRFAAEAATMIVPPEGTDTNMSLKNIVIVRSTFDNVKEFIGPLDKWKAFLTEETDRPIVEQIEAPSFRLSSEKYKGLSKVLFICISGARNNLFNADTMGKIIKQSIIINKLK